MQLRQTSMHHCHLVSSGGSVTAIEQEIVERPGSWCFRLGLELQALVLSIGLFVLSLLLLLTTEAGVIVLVPCFTNTLFIEQGKVGG